MKSLSFFGLALSAVLLSSGAIAQQYLEGTHYTEIETPVNTKVSAEQVELVEVFSYACPHCQRFEPHINEWLANTKPDNVVFRRVPASFNPTYQTFAQAYVTADVLGVAEETHGPMFSAIHEEKRRFRNTEDLLDFYNEFGVDKEQFKSTAESFAVVTRLSQEANDIGRYGIRGTPSLIINGKYLVSATKDVPTHPEMIAVANYLIDQELARMKQAVAAE